MVVTSKLAPCPGWESDSRVRGIEPARSSPTGFPRSGLPAARAPFFVFGDYMTENIHLRWMIRRDLQSVLRIESMYNPEPWVESDVIYFLSQQNAIALVFEDDFEVLGFMFYWVNNRSFLIEKLVVQGEYRRRGIGTEFLNRLKKKTSPHVRRKVVHACDEANLPGQLFLKANGFEATTVIRDYHETGRDAYRFEYWHPSVKRSENASRKASQP